MTQPQRLILTEADKRSPLWIALMAHWEGKIEGLRLKNEGNAGEAETANLRGRIAEIRANLALDKEQPKLEI